MNVQRIGGQAGERAGGKVDSYSVKLLLFSGFCDAFMLNYTNGFTLNYVNGFTLNYANGFVLHYANLTIFKYT